MIFFLDIIVVVLKSKLSNLFCRWVAKVMVWTSLFLSIGLLIVGGVYCGYKYNEITEVSGDDKDGVDDLISIGFTTNLDAYFELSSSYLCCIL